MGPRRRLRLIGYCGRYLGDADADDVPKYVLPKGFKKELEVFNLHQIDPAKYGKVAVVVESFLSVIKHYPTQPVVSFMGRSVSQQQIDQLVEKGFERAVVIFDGDEPGYDGARQVAGELSRHLWAKTLVLEEGVKPHHLDPDDLYLMVKRAW